MKELRGPMANGGDNMGVSDEDLESYRNYFARDTDVMIDLHDLAGNLPLERTNKQGWADQSGLRRLLRRDHDGIHC